MKRIIFAVLMTALTFSGLLSRPSWAASNVKTQCAVTRMEGLSNSSKPPALGDTITLDTSVREIKKLTFVINDQRDTEYPTSWLPLTMPLEKNRLESLFSDTSFFNSNVTVVPIGMGPIRIKTAMDLKLDDQGNGTAIFHESKIDNSRGMVNSISQSLTTGEISEGHDADARPENFILEMKCVSVDENLTLLR